MDVKTQILKIKKIGQGHIIDTDKWREFADEIDVLLKIVDSQKSSVLPSIISESGNPNLPKFRKPPPPPPPMPRTVQGTKRTAVCQHQWCINEHQKTKYCTKGCDGFKEHYWQTER